MTWLARLFEHARSCKTSPCGTCAAANRMRVLLVDLLFKEAVYPQHARAAKR